MSFWFRSDINPFGNLQVIVNDHMIVTLYVNIIFKQFTADWRCEVLHLCTICVSCVDITFIYWDSAAVEFCWLAMVCGRSRPWRQMSSLPSAHFLTSHLMKRSRQDEWKRKPQWRLSCAIHWCFHICPHCLWGKYPSCPQIKKKMWDHIIAQLIRVQHELPSTYNDIQQIVHESWLTIYLVQLGKI